MSSSVTIRQERHFGGRLVRCFADRLGDSYEALVRAAGVHGARDAVVFGEARISYSELLAEVGRVATGLAQTGIRPGDRIALLCGNRPEFVTILYGALKLGAIVVPLDMRLRAPEIAYIVNNSGAALLAYAQKLAGEVPAADDLPEYCRTLAIPENGRLFDGIGEGDEADRHVPRSEEDVALVVFTSGTTGRPKGAMLTHLNIEHSCQHFHLAIDITAADRIGVVTPVTHITGLIMGVMGTLHAGAAVLLMETFKAANFIAFAERERMTQIVMVPAMYSLCLLEDSFDKADLSAWRVGNYGGAPMPEGVILALAEKLPRLQLVNGYGATETCSPATMLRPGEGVERAYSVGRALHCVDLKIVDREGNELPAGEAGEILIAGPMVATGYWQNPEATEIGFADGYWRSGDVGSLDEEGYLRIHDRIKDVVNRGGYKIYSAEVENVLSRYGGVVESAVVGRPSPVLGERVHAFVSVASGEVTVEQLQAFCAGQLADYKVPESFTITMERLPRNANGKLDKKGLRETTQSMPDIEPRRKRESETTSGT
ncbi:MAG: AMP-binding protein [Pseudomonadota bacterium]|nr:AMP-binding protein [Pseudomonadota bacterium]